MTAMRSAMFARLNALLNRDGSAEIGRLAPPLFPSSLPEVDALQRAALEQRPMLRAAAFEAEAAAAATSLAKREIIPDFTFGLQYAQRGSDMGTEHMGSLMIGASIPLFATRRQYRMREEMRAMESMAQAELSEMRAETGARIREMYSGITTARTLASLYRKEVLPQAHANVQSALNAYRSGSVDFMTLLDARMQLNRYREEGFSFVASEGTAWAELEMLVGLELLDASTIDPDKLSNGGVQ
jgi:outer membrane protein TolC